MLRSANANARGFIILVLCVGAKVLVGKFDSRAGEIGTVFLGGINSKFCCFPFSREIMSERRVGSVRCGVGGVVGKEGGWEERELMMSRCYYYLLLLLL